MNILLGTMVGVVIGMAINLPTPAYAQKLTVAASASTSAVSTNWTVESIIKKHAMAIGDIGKVHSRRVKLRILGMAPFEIPTIVEAKRPNLIRREVNVQGQLQITGYDGKDAWKIDPFMPSGKKAIDVAVEDLPALLEETIFDGIVITASTLGFSPRYLGEQQIAGRTAHVIKVTVPGTGETTVFLDTTTFLEVKRLQKRLVMGRMTDLEVFSSDYRQQDGMWIPFKMEIGTVGASQRMSMVIDAVENNPSIVETRFKRPN
jgi:outer membrane lipoprotein-sorting protein